MSDDLSITDIFGDDDEPTELEPAITSTQLYNSLTTQQKLWLAFYLDRNGPAFMNGTEAAVQAGYSSNRRVLAKTSTNNRRKLKELIDLWTDNNVLDEVSIKRRLADALDFCDSQVIKMPGRVDATKLPAGCRVVSVSSKKTLYGEEVTTLVEVRKTDNANRLKALDMAMRLKGMYAPERHEITIPIDRITKARQRALTDESE